MFAFPRGSTLFILCHFSCFASGITPCSNNNLHRTYDLWVFVSEPRAPALIISEQIGKTLLTESRQSVKRRAPDKNGVVKVWLKMCRIIGCECECICCGLAPRPLMGRDGRRFTSIKIDTPTEVKVKEEDAKKRE